MALSSRFTKKALIMSWIKHSKLQREHLYQAKSEIQLALQLFCHPPHLNLPNVTIEPNERITWNSSRKSFDTIFFGEKYNVQLSLDVVDFKLKILVEEIAFDALSLYKRSAGEILKWVTDRFFKLKIDSEYFKSHTTSMFGAIEFGAEEKFDFYRREDFLELAKYYNNAFYILARLKENLERKKLLFYIHPENISISAGLVTDIKKNIHFGFSPGDGSFPEPYYFVKFYPQPTKGVISGYSPPVGQWHHDEWTGLVLTAGKLIKENEELEEHITFDFLKNAIEISDRILVT